MRQLSPPPAEKGRGEDAAVLGTQNHAIHECVRFKGFFYSYFSFNIFYETVSSVAAVRFRQRGLHRRSHNALRHAARFPIRKSKRGKIMTLPFFLGFNKYAISNGYFSFRV